MILTHITALFSLWLLVIGAGTLFALSCLTVRLLCSIAHMLLKAWVKPEKRPAVIPQVAWAGAGAQETWAEGGEWEQPSASVRVEEIPVKAEPVPLRATVIAAGEFGRRFLPDVLDPLPSLQGVGAVRVAGSCPTGRAPDRSLDNAIKDVKARSISITPRELTIARYRPGDPVESLDGCWIGSSLRSRNIHPKLWVTSS